MDWKYVGELTLSIVLLAPGIVILALFVWWSALRATVRIAESIFGPLGQVDETSGVTMPVRVDTKSEP